MGQYEFCAKNDRLYLIFDSIPNRMLTHSNSKPQQEVKMSTTEPQCQAAQHTIPHPRFRRREDLTQKDRLYIAIVALNARIFGEWGTITQLARDFNISRTFVYMLAAAMVSVSELAFGVERLTLGCLKKPSVGSF
jgi:hypothetical protein